MQYFMLKEVFFFNQTKNWQSQHGFLTKKLQKIPKNGQKEGRNSIFLENSLS